MASLPLVNRNQGVVEQRWLRMTQPTRAHEKGREHLGTTPTPVTVQITPEPSPAVPTWMGEVAAFAHVLIHTDVLKTIQEQVCFARARFGQYDLIDFVVVLIGYILSGEPTLLAFYERLAPFASAFMALFGRNRLPHRSTLSRFLAALDQPTVEPCGRSFRKMCWRGSRFLPLAVCLTGQAGSGS